MTTTPAPTDHDARQDLAEAVAALVAIADKIGAAINYTPQHHTVELTLGNLDQLIRERDAAREELAKTRADVEKLTTALDIVALREIRQAAELAKTRAELDEIKGKGSPGVMHEVDRAFYDLTIKERDVAREEVESRKINEKFLADWVKRLKAELAEARQTIAARDAALDASTETHRIAQQIVLATLGANPATTAETADEPKATCDLADPNACRHCGINDQDHANRWTETVGWHTWVDPGNEVRKTRMLLRRQNRKPAAS